MKYIGWILLLLLTTLLFAQGQEAYVISQQGWVQFGAVYESWKDVDGIQLKETSFPVGLYLPMGRAFSLSLRGNQASASGDELKDLKGLTTPRFSFPPTWRPPTWFFPWALTCPAEKKS